MRPRKIKKKNCEYNPSFIDEIIKKLDYKKVKFDNLRFLAGDV